jgi:HKD family nuclease
MADENLLAVEPIRSPWRERLLAALERVQHELLVVGPYIKDDVITMLKDALQARQNPRPLSVRVITRTLSEDFLSGASDIAALQHLLAWSDELPGSSVEVRVINNIHAKVWVFDSDLAFVGSGNATFSGMEVNLEYGIAISDPQIIASILQDWQEWWELAAPLNAQMLDELHRWLDALTNDAEICAAEKLVQEKRKAAESQIGAVPRIGKRVIVAPRDRRTIQERAQTPYMVPQTQDEVLPAQSEVMRVPAYHLWQALTWTTPLFELGRRKAFIAGHYAGIRTEDARVLGSHAGWYGYRTTRRIFAANTRPHPF